MDQSEQKVAILKRLREMLVRQRAKFGDYLRLLEQEELSIDAGASSRLLAQVEMEQAIIADIYALKKVIAPLETLYKAAYPETEDTVPKLQKAIDTMATEVVAHNARNRQLLSRRMEELRTEITALRAWPRTASAYAEVVPSLIDITT